MATLGFTYVKQSPAFCIFFVCCFVLFKCGWVCYLLFYCILLYLFVGFVVVKNSLFYPSERSVLMSRLLCYTFWLTIPWLWYLDKEVSIWTIQYADMRPLHPSMPYHTEQYHISWWKRKSHDTALD